MFLFLLLIVGTLQSDTFIGRTNATQFYYSNIVYESVKTRVELDDNKIPKWPLATATKEDLVN